MRVVFFHYYESFSQRRLFAEELFTLADCVSFYDQQLTAEWLLQVVFFTTGAFCREVFYYWKT